MSNEIVPYTDMERMAGAIAKSGLFGTKTPDQALALMLVAQAEGLHPATAAAEFDIIQGRPARKTHSVLARFQSAGGTVEWKELTDTKVTGTFSHRQGGSVTVTWDMARAKQAELAGKDMWKKYPRQMLRARCIAEGIRLVYPAAIGGMLLVEEAQDLPPAKDMGKVEIPNPWTDEIKAAAAAAATTGLASYSAWWAKQDKAWRDKAIGFQEHADFKAAAVQADIEGGTTKLKDAPAALRDAPIDVDSSEVPQEGAE